MSLLTPDTGLLFWMTLSFGIVFFILARFAFPVITKSIEQRNNYIHSSLDAARQAEEQLVTLNAEKLKILTEAYTERKALLDEALETKKRIEAEALESAGAKVAIRMKKATEEIEDSKRRALEEIKNQIVDISVKIAGKAIHKELGSNKKQTELITRLLDEEIMHKK